MSMSGVLGNLINKVAAEKEQPMGRMSFDPDMEGSSYESKIMEELATLAYAVSDDYRYASIEAAKSEKHITKYTLPDIMSVVQQERLRAKLEEAKHSLYKGYYNPENEPYAEMRIEYLTKQLKEYESRDD